MTDHTETAFQRALNVPARLTQNSVVGARSALTRTATLVANGKRYTNRLGATGLRVNTVAYEGIEELIKHQVSVLDGFMEDTAQRLSLAAEAGSLNNLFAEQASLFAQTRDRMVTDMHTTLRILDDTRTNLSAAVREGFVAQMDVANSDTIEAASEDSAGDTAEVTAKA
ncbi:MAG: TIGR01841 family phasin [Pseudomonadota bacterium]